MANQNVRTRLILKKENPFSVEFVDVVKSYNLTKRDYDNLLPYLEVIGSDGLKRIIGKEYVAGVKELATVKKEVKVAAEEQSNA